MTTSFPAAEDLPDGIYQIREIQGSTTSGDTARLYRFLSDLVRRIRPAYPDATVHEFDLSPGSGPNCEIAFHTQHEEDVIRILLSREWAREQFEYRKAMEALLRVFRDQGIDPADIRGFAD